MVTQVQFFLLDLACESAYAERAKQLFWVAFYNPDMVHPTTPSEDVLLDAYHEKHEFDEFRLKDPEDCNYDGHADWRNFTNVILEPILKLAQSDDVITRSAAQGMVQFLDLTDDDDHCELYYKLATSKEELYVVVNSIYRRRFNDKLFLNNKEDVHSTFEFVKKTYNNPLLGFLKYIGDADVCIEDTAECMQFYAVQKYGLQYLTAYQKHQMQRICSKK